MSGYTKQGNLQKLITATTYTILDADNKYTLIFSNASGCAVTLDLLTTPNFECSFYNDGVGDVDFSDGTATGSYIDGTKLEQDKVAALIKVEDTDVYKFIGGLTT